MPLLCRIDGILAANLNVRSETKSPTLGGSNLTLSINGKFETEFTESEMMLSHRMKTKTCFHRPSPASAPCLRLHAAAKPDHHQTQRPTRSAAPPSIRLIAVQQLLRIEEGGAYAGLVNGATASPRASQGPSSDDDNESDEIQLETKSHKYETSFII